MRKKHGVFRKDQKISIPNKTELLKIIKMISEIKNSMVG